MLLVEGFYANYGPVAALRDVSLRVEDGEAVCLLGSNGAGKSTLIKSVMGLGPQVAGGLQFANVDLNAVRVEDRVRNGLAVVFEGRGILQAMTVRENLLMGGYCRSNTDAARSLDDIVTAFPILRERQSQPAGTLSGGEQQMLAIARAMMANPRMIMLDEPSMGLAPIVVERVFEMIDQINQRGVAILLVEQNVHMALGVSKRFYILDRGAVVLEGRVENGVLTAEDGTELSEEEIESAYLGERS